MDVLLKRQARCLRKADRLGARIVMARVQAGDASTVGGAVVEAEGLGEVITPGFMGEAEGRRETAEEHFDSVLRQIRTQAQVLADDKVRLLKQEEDLKCLRDAVEKERSYVYWSWYVLLVLIAVVGGPWLAAGGKCPGVCMIEELGKMRVELQAILSYLKNAVALLSRAENQMISRGKFERMRGLVVEALDALGRANVGDAADQ